MSVFTTAELRYMAGGRQLGRIATVGADGTPHVVPVAWIYNAARDAIDVGGHELDRTKKFRDVSRTGRAAIVIDDLASTDPWHPRGNRRMRLETASGSAAELRRALAFALCWRWVEEAEAKEIDALLDRVMAMLWVMRKRCG